MAERPSLRQRVFKREGSRDARASLISYIADLCQQAKGLSLEARTGSRGLGIAIDICAALLWHRSWIESGDEPILSEMLDISYDLDRNPDRAGDPKRERNWQRMFELIDQLVDKADDRGFA